MRLCVCNEPDISQTKTTELQLVAPILLEQMKLRRALSVRQQPHAISGFHFGDKHIQEEPGDTTKVKQSLLVAEESARRCVLFKC